MFDITVTTIPRSRNVSLSTSAMLLYITKFPASSCNSGDYLGMVLRSWRCQRVIAAALTVPQEVGVDFGPEPNECQRRRWAGYPYRFRGRVDTRHGDAALQVSPTDPATYGNVAVLVSTLSIIACRAPALGAAHIDPVVTLRE
jgi:hypothetical protein